MPHSLIEDEVHDDDPPQTQKSHEKEQESEIILVNSKSSDLLQPTGTSPLTTNAHEIRAESSGTMVKIEAGHHQADKSPAAEATANNDDVSQFEDGSEDEEEPKDAPSRISQPLTNESVEARTLAKVSEADTKEVKPPVIMDSQDDDQEEKEGVEKEEEGDDDASDMESDEESSIYSSSGSDESLKASSKKSKQKSENSDDEVVESTRQVLNRKKRTKDIAARRVEDPTENDVLLGRGKPYQSHLGNRRMLRIVTDHKSEYCSLKRDLRHAFADNVLDKILSGGTRFLKKSVRGDYWLIVPREVAFEKISHALRNKRSRQLQRKRRLKAAQQQQSLPLNKIPTHNQHPGIGKGAQPAHVSHYPHGPAPGMVNSLAPPANGAVPQRAHPYAQGVSASHFQGEQMGFLPQSGAAMAQGGAAAASRAMGQHGPTGLMSHPMMAGRTPTVGLQRIQTPGANAQYSFLQQAGATVAPGGYNAHAGSVHPGGVVMIPVSSAGLMQGASATSMLPSTPAYDQFVLRRLIQEEAMNLVAQRDQQQALAAATQQQQLAAQQRNMMLTPEEAAALGYPMVDHSAERVPPGAGYGAANEVGRVSPDYGAGGATDAGRQHQFPPSGVPSLPQHPAHGSFHHLHGPPHAYALYPAGSTPEAGHPYSAGRQHPAHYSPPHGDYSHMHPLPQPNHPTPPPQQHHPHATAITAHHHPSPPQGAPPAGRYPHSGGPPAHRSM